MTPPEIGDIRYAVYTEPIPDGKPWVCRLQLVGFSPGGKKARWKAIDERHSPVETFDANYPPASSPEEAITRFQRFQTRTAFFESDIGTDRRIQLILAAESLRAEIAEKSKG